MLEAGIDNATIVSTLLDAGLTNEQAISLIEKSKGASSPAPTAQAPAPQAHQDIKALRNELEAQATAHEMTQTTTQSALDDHEEKIQSIYSQVNEVKSMVSAPSSDTSISQRITLLEGKVDEVSAVSKSLRDLLSKILETNRKILTELEAKK
jgi:hypothetical protein